MDAEVEFLVAGSNRHLGVRMRIIRCAWFEHNVSIELESTNQPQILQATRMQWPLRHLNDYGARYKYPDMAGYLYLAP